MSDTKGLKAIEKLYKKLTYFDQYGSSIALLIIITIILFLICAYCFVMINIVPIQDNWPQERCKLNIMPFAGLINAPSGTSISDYTSQNFSFCLQNKLSSVAGYAMEPVTFVTNMLTELMNGIKDSLNAVRGMFDKIRTSIQNIVQELMGRIMNMMIPLLTIIISMKDFLAKVQGIIVAGLYTLMGSFMTIQSLFGAIAQIIIIILIALAAVVMAMWIIPATWGVAAVMTVIFIGIATPMAIILAFMIEYLHVKPDLSIPTIKCFDKNTQIKLKTGQYISITDVNVGDELFDGDKITTKIKVTSKNSIMYNLNGIIVSDSHKIKYNNTWKNVSEHPEAIIINNYDEEFLYCLNTESKVIKLQNYIFSDWDEVFDPPDNKEMVSNINSGFGKNTVVKLKNGKKKEIDQIKIGDILEGESFVYGIVEINGHNMPQFRYNIYNNTFYGSTNLIYNNKNKIHSTNNLDINEKQIVRSHDKLYHLLTNNSTFRINNLIVYDYNTLIDVFLTPK
jgi:hypothetical protein